MKYASYLGREYKIISIFGSNEGLNEVNLLFKMHNYALKNNKIIIFAERNNDFIIDLADQVKKSGLISGLSNFYLGCNKEKIMLGIDLNTYRNTDISLQIACHGWMKYSLTSNLNYFHRCSGLIFNINNTVIPNMQGINDDKYSIPLPKLDLDPLLNPVILNYSKITSSNSVAIGKNFEHGDISNFNTFNWKVFVSHASAINILKKINVHETLIELCENKYGLISLGMQINRNYIVNTFRSNYRIKTSCCIKRNFVKFNGSDSYNNVASEYICSSYMKFSHNTYKNLFFDINSNIGYDLCDFKMYQIFTNSEGLNDNPYLGYNDYLLHIFPFTAGDNKNKRTLYLPADYSLTFGMHLAKKINSMNDHIIVDGYVTLAAINNFCISQNTFNISLDFIPCLYLSISYVAGYRNNYFPFVNTSCNIGIVFTIDRSTPQRFVKLAKKTGWCALRIMDAFDIN